MAFNDQTGAIVAPVNNGGSPEAAGVEYIRHDLYEMFPQYDTIDDCMKGQIAIKNKKTQYLPMPFSEEALPTPQDILRYDAYITRAVFYNVVRTTASAMLGQVFDVDPVINVPTLLDAVVKDANGNGVSLAQLAQQTERDVLGKGRAGLLVDFPTVEAGKQTTKKDQEEGTIRPTISSYGPKAIRNWRNLTRGGKTILSLVVLHEFWEKADDGFALTMEDQYRVLRLDASGKYFQQIWRGTTGNWTPTGEPLYPLDSKGAQLEEIPFTFVGAVDNSPSIDEPPLYDMSSLNIAHYHNSADYEESVFIAGQATPVLTGLDQNWVENILKGKVRLGSRAAIPLPTGGSAALLQMAERSAPFEAMEHKERQMTALGAKLVEQKSVQRTATEAGQDKASENSVLTTVTKNVSAAYEWALEWCAIFAGVTTVKKDAKADGEQPGAIVFELNTEFDLANITPEQLKTYLEAWDKGALTFTEMRTGLRKAGLATEDDTKAKAAIEADKMADAEFAMKTDFNSPAVQSEFAPPAGGGA